MRRPLNSTTYSRVFLAIALMASIAAILFCFWGSDSEPLPVSSVTVDGMSVSVVLIEGKQLEPRRKMSFRSYSIDEYVNLLPTNFEPSIYFVRLNRSAGDKKRHRAAVEKAVSGHARRRALRSLIPLHLDVCTSDAVTHESVYDDLNYFKDNFGGYAWLDSPSCVVRSAPIIDDLVNSVFQRSP